MTPRPPATDEEYRAQLTPEQYHVTREKGTERAFTGAYWDCKDEGVYRCVCCDAALFSSDTKYDSGTGWPSFYQALDSDAVTTESDRSFGMVRTEAMCANCGAHLGHVFPDGPQPTGDRFCMNSASLRLDRDASPTEPAEPADPAEG
jgi:peptide-methionine (R)-S-oxide reductase